MTKILMHKWTDGKLSGLKSASVIVPHCPMFEDAEKNPEVAALIADGYHISGHIDGVEQ